MFARHVSVNLKPKTLADFTKTMESEILPSWGQTGFLDLITLADTAGREIIAISFWDQKENAQTYNSIGYPEALKILKKLLDGTPHVRTFDVVSSTLQKIAPRVTS